MSALGDFGKGVNIGAAAVMLTVRANLGFFHGNVAGFMILLPAALSPPSGRNST